MAANGNSYGLRPRQRRAIAALMSTRNVSEAARAAKIGPRTLYRWMGQANFRAALLEAEGEAIDQATRRLIALQDKAIDALESILGASQANDGDRRLAAQAILSNMLHFRELRDLEARLVELETIVYEKESSKPTY